MAPRYISEGAWLRPKPVPRELIERIRRESDSIVRYMVDVVGLAMPRGYKFTASPA